MWLKQSTAATIVMGPFVDETDGKTQETALTISQADIRLSKNGAAFAQTNNAAGATHMEKGNYSVPLDTTDTNTLGRLRVHIHESGALPCWRDFMVVPADTYAYMIAASFVNSSGRVDVGKWLGSAVSSQIAGKIPALEILWNGTVVAATSTTVQLDSAASSSDNAYKGYGVLVSNSTGSIQHKRLITSYVGATRECNLDQAWPSGVTIDNTFTYAIVGDNATDLALWRGEAPNELDSARVDVSVSVNNDKLDYSLSTLAQSTLTDYILDKPNSIETGFTWRQTLRLMSAALVGRVEGAGTTSVDFWAMDDNRKRILATVDTDGNRVGIGRDAG